MNELFIPKGLTDIQPIREIIYQQLKSFILDGILKPGDKLIERDIAAKFNTSRTPVREAVRKLETEGLIEYLPRKGVVVRGFNIGEVQEIFKIRKALECLAIQKAIQNMTSEKISALEHIVRRLEMVKEEDSTLPSVEELLFEFDEVIIDTADMPILKGFIKTLNESLQRYRRLNLSKLTRRSDAVKEHKSILQAIIKRDTQLAEELVCIHIDNAQRELLKSVK
ncbi:MAG: GntR family transcriptional regulator [Peptococcaceae bacterium]|nr:GntR family transcriptional regulator [Peptococcaceae bacterium]